MTVPPRLKCRPITDADLGQVAGLLARGFPARTLVWWQAGLARLAARTVPEGYPRFGFMLDHDGTPVGVILVIAQAIGHDGPPYVRLNLSSWYVEPAYRSHAAMLAMMPLRFKGATLLNVSPAPNTRPVIEAQGFRRYTGGQRVALPALRRGGERGLRVARFDPAAAPSLPEAGLLGDHAALGALALVGHGAGEPVPFVFLPVRVKQGRLPLPGVQLVFCRDLADVVRFAAPLGRFLLKRGTPFLLFDAEPGMTELPGVFVPDRAPKYVRGPHPPRLGDMAYTEFTIFGP